MKFDATVTYTVTYYLEVEADTFEEAIEKANEGALCGKQISSTTSEPAVTLNQK